MLGKKCVFGFDFYADAFIGCGRLKYIECELFSKAGTIQYNLFMYVMIKQLIQVFFSLHFIWGFDNDVDDVGVVAAIAAFYTTCINTI